MGFLLVGLCLVLAVALYAWQVFERSPPYTERARARLAGQLAGERLGDMLLRRRIRPSAYVRSVPLPELKRQIRVCRRCPDQTHCEYLLASRGTRPAELAFCPNHAAISAVARQTDVGIGTRP